MISPSDTDVLLRLATALACGGLIGLERDFRNMPTGFRTLSIVCLGSCVAVIAALKAGDSDGFSRVAQGIVTGIGFLGGGVILQNEKLKDVKGLTTAAAIWITAAIGLMCGIGELLLALAAAAMTVVVLLLDIALHKWRPVKAPEANTERAHAAKPHPGGGDSDKSG